MHFPAHCFFFSNPVAAPTEITKRMVVIPKCPRDVANWQKPTPKLSKSYEAKQMNQAKPVINIAEEFQQSLSDEKPPSAHTDKQREARKAEKSEVATRFLKCRQETFDG